MSQFTRILLYDIASGPPVTCFAPNPWKARYALNLKRADYKTVWAELTTVAPNRNSPDGPAEGAPKRTLPYTLPIIEDLLTGEVLGDSFKIALYLDRIYPDAPRLVPRDSAGLHAAFNAQVNEAMSPWLLLYSHGLPLNPETAEATRAQILERGPCTNWDDLAAQGQERTELLEEMKQTLGELVKCYRRRDEGPFLEGATPIFADCIVGGWLAFFSVALDGWDQVKTWHDGLWGDLHEAMEEYAEVR